MSVALQALTVISMGSIADRCTFHSFVLELVFITGGSVIQKAPSPHFRCNRCILREPFSSPIVDVSVVDGLCAVCNFG